MPKILVNTAKYLVYIMNSSREREQAIKIMLVAATAAAAIAGGYVGILNKIPGAGHAVLLGLTGVEVWALTRITKRMCGRITEVYGYRTISGMSQFIGVIVGAAIGLILANKILQLVPGVGEAAQAVATATLHLVTGTAIIAVCELIREDIIDEAYISNAKTEQVSKILGTVVDIFAGSVRSLLSGASIDNSIDAGIEKAKEQFRTSVHTNAPNF